MKKENGDTDVNANPTSDTEWTVHSLNIQGTFFERWCQEKIKESRWDIISTNYPVEFPPHNGPFVGEQSALDIYAQLKKTTILLTLLIECKKNNPEFIDWVFFPHSNKKRHKHFNGSLIQKAPTQDANKNWDTTGMISQMISLEWIPTSEAWETRGKYADYKRGDKTRTSNTSITDAAHQVSLATRAIFQKELNNTEVLSSKQVNMQPSPVHQIFIPTIVTTAKLLLCNFDVKDIDEKTGEIPFSKATFEEQPYLLYEYPLPVPFHSTPSDELGVLKTGDKDFGTRMDILVVNSSHLSEFLSKLDNGNA